MQQTKNSCTDSI